MGQVGIPQQALQGHKLRGGQVCRGGDGAHRAARQLVKQLIVVATQQRQPAVGQHGFGGSPVGAAVFDGADLRMLSQCQQRGWLDAHTRAGGHVVDHQRQRGGAGHGVDVIRNAGL